MTYTTLDVQLADKVATITLNRPERANAMEQAMWDEIPLAMQWADATSEVRCVIIKGAGKHFTAGLDLGLLAGLAVQVADDDEGRSHEKLRRLILKMQEVLTSIEKCRKPVLAAVLGACVGGGIDLITACDMRYCSAPHGTHVFR